MTQWIYKPMLLLFFLGLTSNIYAADREEHTKTIKKEFAITSDGEVSLSNQFGKIEIETWNQNKVKITVNIIARTSTEKQAQDVFDRIDIEFANGNDYVKAVTDIETNKSWWGWGNNNFDFSINYEVFLPKTVALDIKNRHGDTYIVEMAGKADLDIQHGSITADGFTGDLQLKMAHSNGTISAANNLEADVAHSNIRFKKLVNIDLEAAHGNVDIGNAKKIKLDARHANFDIGDIEELRVDSRHSNFEIGTVNSIYSESGHSTYEIDKVSKNVDFDFSHGGATIDFLEKGFEEVILAGSHAGFKIKIDEQAAYELDAYGTHAGMRYPMDLDVTYEKDKNNTQEIRGSKGGSSNRGKIRARLSHGGLKLR